jgi:hypothetical protein
MTLPVCTFLALAILWATGLLVVRLNPYWVARFRGRDADLRGASLPLARLCGANLPLANLEGANLRGADLRHANLLLACLNGADLRGDDLRGANLDSTRLHRADLRGADLRGIKTSECGISFLWQAKGARFLTALHGDAAMTKLLLRYGAYVNARCRGGKTPLTWARRGGNKAVIELLERTGAREWRCDPPLPDDTGWWSGYSR